MKLSLRILLAATAGSLCVLSFSPFSIFPVAVLALVVFYHLLVGQSMRDAFLIGWGFGIGLLGFGIFWIRISLNEYGNMSSGLAYLMTFLLVTSMALYYGIAGALASRMIAGTHWGGPLLAFPAAFLLTEWVRGWLFTGFPWLAIGYSQIDSPLAGFAPIVGVYGVSLAVALSAGFLWGFVRWPGRASYFALGGLCMLWLAGAALTRIEWTRPQGAPFMATVVQANIQQSVKWHPESRIPTLQAYLELTRDNWDSDLIVWPETAVPDFLLRVQNAFVRPLAEEARKQGSELVIGIPVMDLEERTYYNGLISIGSGEDIYRKRHLVPFGEFIPFKGLLGPIAEAFEVPMSDFSAGDAVRPLLRVGDHLAGVSICYEDVFPAEVREALPEAAYLINVSNDAWFGDSLAPHQHLEMARMRALENERWMVRSTNTGISAILDHRGDVVGTVPSFERGALTARVHPRVGATPFVYVGNWLAVGAAFSMLGAAFLLVRRRKARSS